LTLVHPETQELLTFTVEPDFKSDPRRSLRQSLVDPQETTAYRVLHGAGDAEPGWYCERLGDYLLIQSEAESVDARMLAWAAAFEPKGIYHKRLERRVRRTQPEGISPCLAKGEEAPGRFWVRENGRSFEVSLQEGYSIGLFLDQRENRRRFLVNHVAADFPLFPEGPAGCEVLNTFAYTCAFSVCAAVVGARTTSLDLSRKYLEWGERNFVHNGLAPANHEFIRGDVFDWLKRLTKKQRRFDALILDPPTFSHSKISGPFRAESDYPKLVELAVPLLKANGVLLAATNAATLLPEKFVALVKSAVVSRRRRVLAEHYVPQPFDFPITRTEPPHLKTVWLRLS